MKLKITLLLLCFAPSFLFAQDFYKPGYFVIKGRVKNRKDPLIEFGVTNYLNAVRNSIMVKPDGSFERKIPVQNLQSFHIMLNEEFLTFSVFNKDTLYLDWNDADFNNTFSIRGKNDLRTKELQVQLKLYQKFWKPFMNLHQELAESREKFTEAEKFNLINGLYNLHIKDVLDSAGFFSPTLNHLITGLYFQYSGLLWQQRLLPQFKLRLDLGGAGPYPPFDIAGPLADYKQLNEDWFRNVPEYRDFIYNYIRFYKPFNSYGGSLTADHKLFNPTLDDYYLAQSNIYFTKIKDWFITNLIMWDFGSYPFADVEKVYHQFISTCSSPFLKDTLQKYYTAMKRLKPGSPAPGFTLKNEKGKTVSLSDFKGKVVYIDFWGVECPPCIYDIQNHVPQLHERYKNKEVVFINICVDAKEAQWKEALEKYGLNGVNLIAEGWTNHPACKAYNVSGIPHYILVDKNGRIADNNAPRADGFNPENGKNAIDLLLQ